MNREDIIRMAKEAQMPFYWRTGEITYLDKLETFAALVASVEREECAKECDIQASIGNDDERFGARQCGYAIRARGQA